MNILLTIYTMKILLAVMVICSWYSLFETAPALNSNKGDHDDWYGKDKRNYMDFFGLNGDMQRFKKGRFDRYNRPDFEWN